jgi:hypothetical protein
VLPMGKPSWQSFFYRVSECRVVVGATGDFDPAVFVMQGLLMIASIIACLCGIWISWFHGLVLHDSIECEQGHSLFQVHHSILQ